MLTGRQPRARVADLLIAATAVTQQATLWTRNAKDLAGLADLVEIYESG
ncbi:MAG: toxin FitB [Pseudonocardiales bacterium]|nr:toxin FitB [Pseudonocardiales bacterium]